MSSTHLSSSSSTPCLPVLHECPASSFPSRAVSMPTSSFPLLPHDSPPLQSDHVHARNNHHNNNASSPPPKSMENDDETPPINLPLHSLLDPSSFQAPETPQQPMDFLSRSWSISAMELARALGSMDARKRMSAHHQYSTIPPPAKSAAPSSLQETGDTLTTVPFSIASSVTAQLVLDRLMALHTSSDASAFSSRRNSHSSSTTPSCFLGRGGASAATESPPLSPRQADDLSFCRSSSAMKVPLKGMSMKRWLKDMKERKKEATRIHNSQIHAAVSVAGVAAAVAAIAASTAAFSRDDVQNKTSNAVASAAALVAAQCVEMAESMGADRDQVSSAISSAVSVKTAGDVTTLTAAAATALRAAETLKARALKNNQSHATVIPYERGCATSPVINSSGELVSEDGETEFSSQDLLRRGAEFLKRTRKGELHWRILFVYLNKESQVIVKSQGKYMGGKITKSKKRRVLEVILDIPAWPGRQLLDDAEQRKYFGIKTDTGVMELECKNETEYRLWTEGISRLLSFAQHQRTKHRSN